MTPVKNFKFLVVNNSFKILLKHLSNFRKIPGPKALPCFGTMYKYLPLIGEYRFDRLHHNGMKKYLKFGPVIREEIVPGVNIIWLFKPEDFEIMFRSEGKYPLRRSHLALEKFRLDRPNIYNTGGLLPTNGPNWHKIRKVFQQGLSSPVDVKNFICSSNEIMEEWLTERVEFLRKTESSTDLLPELSRVFLELTGQAALDIRLNSFKGDELKKNSRSTKLIQAALDSNSCILKTDNGPQLWRKFDTPLYKKLKKAQIYMEEVAIDLLSFKMSLYDENDSKTSPTLLEQYLSRSELEFKDIIGMVCDFLLAGIDTTTYSTSFLLYHLGISPDVQEKVYNESCKLLHSETSSITEEILQEVTYSRAVLKELFRLRPISVGIGRVLQSDSEFSGYHVPKNTVVVTQNQVSCRLEKYFAEPEKFKPERWLRNDPLYTRSHPFLLLPFGHGPRACIARRLAEQNMLIMMLKIVRKYKIHWKGGHLDSISLLINKPDGPINIQFEKR